MRKARDRGRGVLTKVDERRGDAFVKVEIDRLAQRLGTRRLPSG